MTIRARSTTIVLLALTALFGAGADAYAQVQRSFINTSFEQPVVPSTNCWTIREAVDVPGWETSEPTYTGAWNTGTHGTCGGHPASPPIEGAIQLFRNFTGITAPDGQQWAELNAFTPRRLYQEVCLVSGEQVQWSLFHRGRITTERFQFNIGPNGSGAGATTIFQARTTTSGTGTIETTGLGTVNLVSQAGGSTWAQYSGTFTWNQNGPQTIGFQAVGGDSAGNYLDHIQLNLTPYIEFQPGSASGAESIPTANIPAIRLSGTLAADTIVQVVVTGGTATLGQDYTTPSGTNTFDVVIPAGEYDGTQAIPTGIEIINDAEFENGETIDFEIVANPAAYTIAGTQACGAVPNAAVSYTILDTDNRRISLTKAALLDTVRRGEEVGYVITATNDDILDANDVTLTDTIPPGFRYVDGSALLDGAAITPAVDGRRIAFEHLSIAGGQRIVIELRLLALSSAGSGEHVNRASLTDATGAALIPDATAVVRILPEPVLECGDVIGRVFDDRDGSGYQDKGELGLPGVRVATVDGWLITTDEHGRFHVPCAALPDQRVGSNFIMKLDSRTLPTGYRLTTENPRVVRLTAGKMTELNFGAAIGRVVRLDLQDAAFVSGGLELRPEWARGIEQLLAVLGEERSVLRLTYLDAGADPELADRRLRDVGRLIEDRWREGPGEYRLEIEMRVETGR